MKTPELVSLKEFTDARMKWIAEHAEDIGDGKQRCRSCKTQIELLPAYVSIHAVEFGVLCAGEGKVLRLAIPFCPRCEVKPSERGCIHEPMNPSSREMPRDPRRCDFCMTPGAPLAATYRAKTFMTGWMPSGDQLVDAGEWGACPSCAALVKQKNFAALVEVGVAGTLKMHPEIPRTIPNVAAIRHQAKIVYTAVFGLDPETAFRQKPN